MEWLQFFGFIITVGGLFLWSRTESNADRRELRAAMDAIRMSTDAKIDAIHDEMRDFHARLLLLEERYLKLRLKNE